MFTNQKTFLSQCFPTTVCKPKTPIASIRASHFVWSFASGSPWRQARCKWLLLRISKPALLPCIAFVGIRLCQLSTIKHRRRFTRGWIEQVGNKLSIILIDFAWIPKSFQNHTNVIRNDSGSDKAVIPRRPQIDTKEIRRCASQSTLIESLLLHFGLLLVSLGCLMCHIYWSEIKQLSVLYTERKVPRNPKIMSRNR